MNRKLFPTLRYRRLPHQRLPHQRATKEEVPPPPPNPKDGDFVTFKGKIEGSNANNRPIRIDIFDGDQRNIGGKRPSVVVSTTVESGSTFEMFLPKKSNNFGLGHILMKTMMEDLVQWIHPVGMVATHFLVKKINSRLSFNSAFPMMHPHDGTGKSILDFDSFPSSP